MTWTDQVGGLAWLDAAAWDIKNIHYRVEMCWLVEGTETRQLKVAL